MKRTVVALFSRYDEAENAVQKLFDQGVERNSVSIMAADPEGRVTAGADQQEERAGSGAMVGGLAGAVLGLTAMAIPGIGPVVAAGPLAGALAGGVAGALAALGLKQDRAEYYARGVQQGGAMIAVHTTDSDADEIEARLNNLEGAQLQDPEAARHTNARETLPMYNAASFTPPGDADHQYATADATQPEDATDTRVKNDAGPEHWAPHNAEYQSSFDEFAGEMARNDTYILAGREAEYAGYKDAFDFGFRSASDKQFARSDWSNAEAALHERWDRSGAHPWDRVRTSVQHGWEAARGMG